MWSFKGYSGQGCRGLFDSLCDRPAIVAGSARGVFEEISRAQSILGGSLVFASNDVGVLLPRVDHFVSLHGPRLEHWVALRRDPTGTGYGNVDFEVHDAGKHGTREGWNQWTGLSPLMALSGLFAAQIAFLMGCKPIVLCGCPTDDTPRFWESEGRPGYAKSQQMFLSEVGRNRELADALLSMSGWTKKVLGELRRHVA